MCVVDASKMNNRVDELNSMESPATVVILGEATLQEARDVARQIEQRVQDAMAEEVSEAG